VQHQNSVFHGLLKLIPWHVFDRLVDEHGADQLVRRFKTRHQFIALLFGQLEGVNSLRGIEATMESHRARLYHIGAQVPPRSTFSDANRARSPLVFSGLFDHMLATATRGFKRQMAETVRLIDATSLPLAGLGAKWARFSTTTCGAKAHIVFDPDLGCPLYHVVTPAKVNDITAAKSMPIEAGATYVFDLGYYDYAWWAQLHEMGCRIVTRFKTNTPLHDARTLELPADSPLLSDRIGFLPARQAKSRHNPMHEAVREIVVKTDTGKTLRILSNDLDAPAQEIADLYKRRWQIELFFRLMKQTLRITKFIGRSENAVRIQVAVALIAFLLLHLLRTTTKANHGFLELSRLVRSNLMHRRDVTHLKLPKPPLQRDTRQLIIKWADA
jgi:hypothetical protein